MPPIPAVQFAKTIAHLNSFAKELQEAVVGYASRVTISGKAYARTAISDRSARFLAAFVVKTILIIFL